MPAKIDQFDPTGLERGAAALREINTSPHAGAALQLQLQQQKTRQVEAEGKKSESDAQTWEKRKEYLESETKEHTKRADYEDKLARARGDEERDQRMQDARAEEQRKEAAAKRIEGMKRATEARIQEEKRATIAAEHELHMRSIRATELSKAEGLMRIERSNKDLHMQRLELEKAEERKTFIEVAQTVVSAVSSRMGAFLSDPEAVAKTVGIAATMFVAYHGAKTGTAVVGQHVAALLGKPTLVRETSRRNVISPRETWRRIKGTHQAHQSHGLGAIVLPPAEAQRVKQIAASVHCAKAHRLPHRHLLLHGPPGTGKTMFGRVLAYESGMDYAVMTGGDVGPLGKDAVTELHKMFDWARTSRNGLVVFIDEAEAFLRRRDKDVISEDMRAALNAFLYNTGTETNKFMLVLASNQPQLLDTAVVDRLDSSIYFGLPGKDERLRMLNTFWKQRVEDYDLRKKVGLHESLDVEGLQPILEEVAAMSEGLSGRSLMQFANAVQSEILTVGSTKGELLSRDDIMRLAQLKVDEAGTHTIWENPLSG